MRIFLQGNLKQQFRISFNLLPKRLRSELCRFVVSVRSEDTLNGARFRCADGSYQILSEEGTAYFACDSTTDKLRGCLFLNRTIMEAGTNAFIIANILHELAHAKDFLDWGVLFKQMQNDTSETSAWLQAAAWAAAGRLVFPEALDVVNECLRASAKNRYSWVVKEMETPEDFVLKDEYRHLLRSR